MTTELIENNEFDNYEICWSPNEGSQTLFLRASNYVFEGVDENGNEIADINYILYHGGRGIGKSEVILADIAMHIGVGYGNFFRGIVFRKTSSELEDFIAKVDKFFIQSGAFPSAKLIRGAKPELRFASGEKIVFRHMQNLRDYDKYHGHEYTYIYFEELTLWSEKDIVTNMMSCLRLHDVYNETFKKEIEKGLKPKLIAKIRATTNPYGVGKAWVKKEFIKKEKSGKFFIEDGITKMHIFGHFSENTKIKAAYINNFKNIENKAKRRAWVYGDWDAETGGMFGDFAGNHCRYYFWKA